MRCLSLSFSLNLSPQPIFIPKVMETNKKNTIMKNLENSALMQEMNVNEMQEVNGGWVALALAVAGAAIYVYNNWDDFCVGVNEGWNGTRN